MAGNEGGEFHPTSRPTATGGKVDVVFFMGEHSASKSGFESTDDTAHPWPTGCVSAVWKTLMGWESPPTTACASPPSTPSRPASAPVYQRSRDICTVLGRTVRAALRGVGP